MRVYAIATTYTPVGSDKEVAGFFNLKLQTLQPKLSFDCLSTFEHLTGILESWGPHRDPRYHVIGFSLRSTKSKKGKSNGNNGNRSVRVQDGGRRPQAPGG